MTCAQVLYDFHKQCDDCNSTTEWAAHSVDPYSDSLIDQGLKLCDAPEFGCEACDLNKDEVVNYMRDTNTNPVYRKTNVVLGKLVLEGATVDDWDIAEYSVQCLNNSGKVTPESHAYTRE